MIRPTQYMIGPAGLTGEVPAGRVRLACVRDVLSGSGRRAGLPDETFGAIVAVTLVFPVVVLIVFIR